MIRTLSGYLPRYGAVSIICVVINNVLLVTLDQLGFYYGTAVIISGLGMIPLGFFLQSRFAYQADVSIRAFFRYALILLCNTPAAWVLLYLLHQRGHLPMIAAAPAVTIIMFAWNYLGSFWALHNPVGKFISWR